jgi:hypothetical protein
MGTIYMVHEENPMLQYYNNTFDYYTLNIINSLVLNYNFTGTMYRGYKSACRNRIAFYDQEWQAAKIFLQKERH